MGTPNDDVQRKAREMYKSVEVRLSNTGEKITDGVLLGAMKDNDPVISPVRPDGSITILTRGGKYETFPANMMRDISVTEKDD